MKMETRKSQEDNIMGRTSHQTIDRNRERQLWYFTFGFGQHHQNKYTVFYGTYNEARENMFHKHGQKWAFQYRCKEDAGVDKWGLTEI